MGHMTVTWNNSARLLFIFKHASPIHVHSQAQTHFNEISVVSKISRRATQPHMELQATNPAGAQALQLATVWHQWPQLSPGSRMGSALLPSRQQPQNIPWHPQLQGGVAIAPTLSETG